MRRADYDSVGADSNAGAEFVAGCAEKGWSLDFSLLRPDCPISCKDIGRSAIVVWIRADSILAARADDNRVALDGHAEVAENVVRVAVAGGKFLLVVPLSTRIANEDISNALVRSLIVVSRSADNCCVATQRN